MHQALFHVKFRPGEVVIGDKTISLGERMRLCNKPIQERSSPCCRTFVTVRNAPLVEVYYPDQIV